MLSFKLEARRKEANDPGRTNGEIKSRANGSRLNSEDLDSLAPAHFGLSA
jgi:hypothetical protein